MRGPQFMLGYWKAPRSNLFRFARRLVLVGTSFTATRRTSITFSIAGKK